MNLGKQVFKDHQVQEDLQDPWDQLVKPENRDHWEKLVSQVNQASQEQEGSLVYQEKLGCQADKDLLASRDLLDLLDLLERADLLDLLDHRDHVADQDQVVIEVRRDNLGLLGLLAEQGPRVNQDLVESLERGDSLVKQGEQGFQGLGVYPAQRDQPVPLDQLVLLDKSVRRVPQDMDLLAPLVKLDL